jgi:hypothetical protein
LGMHSVKRRFFFLHSVKGRILGMQWYLRQFLPLIAKI